MLEFGRLGPRRLPWLAKLTIGAAAFGVRLSQLSIRRNAIADDANSAVPFAPEKGLPLGISGKEGATVSN
jgi:hypothetical protein